MGVSVVTGANRGIGLALVTQLHRRGATVVAVCRQASPELLALGVRIVSGIDLADPQAGPGLAARLAQDDIELLVHNAGIGRFETLDGTTASDVMAQFQVNAMAPLFLTRAVLPRLRAGAKVALVSSRMGSIGDNGSGGFYGYRMSKAALNAAGVSLARDLKAAGVAVVVLHPGAVRTGMTGGQGNIEPDKAASGLLQRIDELELHTTGRFLHADGSVLPW
jgi:NAD(P)-dependent dehydrogenase (short-subunit alcohol dehydrogenase family)